MIYSQIEFFIFFPVLLIFVYLTPSFKVKKYLLLLASYYFYAYWDWRFLGLILTSTILDYAIGYKLSYTNNSNHRKWLLSCSLIINLSILGFFKYFNFFIESIKPLFDFFGLETVSLNIILPIGISFYTFQTLSYTIDIYNRKISPCFNFFDFALYVAFFPQLVAGQ